MLLVLFLFLIQSLIIYDITYDKKEYMIGYRILNKLTSFIKKYKD